MERNDRSNAGLHLDRTVTLGNLLIVVTLIIGFLGAVAAGSGAWQKLNDHVSSIADQLDVVQGKIAVEQQQINVLKMTMQKIQFELHPRGGRE